VLLVSLILFLVNRSAEHCRDVRRDGGSKLLEATIGVGDGIWFLLNRIYRIESVAMSLVRAEGGGTP